MEKQPNNIEKLPNNREPLLTTEAISKWLGVSTRTLCLWAECQEIPAFKVGRQWRFRESELAKWLENPESLRVRKLTFANAGGGNI
jgi:excisionase family DNA binding protein